MKSYVKEPIYLDNHVCVVNKPAGLPTQPRPSGGESLEGDIKAWIKQKFHKPGNVFLTPVHRLDLPVSGLVLFARTSKSLSRLQAQMRERKIRKTYFARVEGRLKEKEGCLRHFISHGSRRAQIVSQDQGKEAVLSYRVIKEWKDQTLLELELHTGRYHQIRAQLSFMGHPIRGDVKYGAKTQEDHIDLHHGKLTFFHPISQEEITVESPPPF